MNLYLYNKLNEKKAPIDFHIHLLPCQCDIVLSLGQACRPAYWLRKHNLRFFSSPLDWMMSYDLNVVIKLFKSRFKNFFLNKVENFERNLPHRYVQDIDTGMISMHSFPKNISIDDFYYIFIEKMKNRAERMLLTLEKSSDVIFIANRTFSKKDEVCIFLNEIGYFSSANITFININNIDSDNNTTSITRFSHKYMFIEYSFRDIHHDGSDPNNPAFWLGNALLWDEIMNSIFLTDKFAESYKNIVISEDEQLR